MSKAAVDAYTGEGEPPNCVMVLESHTKIPDGNHLKMEVVLNGTQPLVTINIDTWVTDEICENDSGTESD